MYATCPRLSTIRFNITGTFDVILPEDGWTVPQMVAFVEHPTIVDLTNSTLPSYLTQVRDNFLDSDPDPRDTEDNNSDNSTGNSASEE